MAQTAADKAIEEATRARDQAKDKLDETNLRSVLEAWDKAPLPEVLKIPGGYWLIEGHHRIALQRLAGRHKIRVFTEYEKKK